MDHAQEQVRQLSELTSDTQLRKKVQQKKEEVEKERQKILQSSLEFSNQCKEYKEALQNVLNTIKDLEAEIQFLDDQIEFTCNANKKMQKKLEVMRSK